MRALVVVEDSPLATLLGDSENPAHTQWQRESSHFKNKYTYGPSYIEFVIGSVAAIVRAIVETEQEIDPTLLTDFFPLPSGGDGAQEEGAGDKDKDKKRSRQRRVTRARENLSGSTSIESTEVSRSRRVMPTQRCRLASRSAPHTTCGVETRCSATVQNREASCRIGSSFLCSDKSFLCPSGRQDYADVDIARAASQRA